MNGKKKLLKKPKKERKNEWKIERWKSEKERRWKRKTGSEIGSNSKGKKYV